MIYLLGQIFIWVIAAIISGILIGWVLWGKRLNTAKEQYTKLKIELEEKDKAVKDKSQMQRALADEKLLNDQLNGRLTALSSELNSLKNIKDKKEVATIKPAKAQPLQPASLDKPNNNKADNLTTINGIGHNIQLLLNDLGIFHFEQIANLSKENVIWLDSFLRFKGRIDREEWIEQAKKLSAVNDSEKTTPSDSKEKNNTK